MYTEVLQEIAQPTTIVQIAVKVDKIYEEQSYDGWHCTSVPAAFRRDAQKTSIPVQTCTTGASQIILKMMAMMMMVIYNDIEEKDNNVGDIDVQFLAQSALSGWV